MVDPLTGFWLWLSTLKTSDQLLVVLIFVTGVVPMVIYFLGIRKRPALRFGKVSRNNEPAYFIDVIKKKGEGKAKSCEGWLDIDNTNVTHEATVWGHLNQRLYDIGDSMRLRLFRLSSNNNSIYFPAAHLVEGYCDNEQSLDQFLDRVLRITVIMEHGKSIHYCRSIKEIIREGNEA